MVPGPVTLDPTQGVEIQKTRPCLVISPDKMNQHLQTVIVAPMTTVPRPYTALTVLHATGRPPQETP